MAQSINLIPQSEVQEQVKAKALKASTVFTLLLLVIAGGISAYLYLTNKDLKDQVAILDTEIEGLRSKITDMTAIEVSARNLDKKYSVLKSLFGSRYYYSDLLTEIENHRPPGITFGSFNMREPGEVSVTGTGSTYIDISDFTNNLLADSDLFVSVSLNSVSLQSKDNSVNFAIVVSFNESALQRSVLQ
jgi:type IV pilus assembly protein PilN